MVQAFLLGKHSAVSYQRTAISATRTLLELLSGALTARDRMSKTSRDFQPVVPAPPSLFTTFR
ncbi:MULTISPECIES: hypothetical protein [unclassified Moorena]|uniref:hypothetical protein n=1 Tax=unclassified Moorena TaxID=2683338 RepID=UPI0002E11BEC|nr:MULTISPECIES: hypothetical protein [unclassified Moorena]NEQ14900.1 hypothetical protein [Moorena sp. SIO3E2]NEP32653.1 hypothetical protein [Moorena sp. SIO3B2]NEQ05984.1 hypothetical protein [Moorena sp. SIO4E2]NER90248.1 hypothetical protein [Moorena sp. SIO3A2]NES45371.1 hypothetical protein [Moorena sp. SIO2C4]